MEKKPSEKNADLLNQNDVTMNDVQKGAPPAQGETLESLGAEIRKSREAQGLTLDYVADETKMRKQYLEQIESGKLDCFHGEVYCRGFIKKYLSMVGRMDLWAEYERILKAVSKSEPVMESAPPLGDFTLPARGFRKGSRKGVFLLLLAVIVVTGWYLWTHRVALHCEVERIQQEQVQRVEEEKERQAESSPDVAAQPGLVDSEVSQGEPQTSGDETILSKDLPGIKNLVVSADVVPTSSSKKLSVQEKTGVPVLTVTAVKDSWIRITREGKRIFGGTLKAGKSTQVEASGRIHAIYGRPEFLKVRWNYKGTDPSEEGAGPVHFLYSPDGSHRALSSSEVDDLWIKKTVVQSPDAPDAEEEKKEKKQSPARLLIKASKGDCWVKIRRGQKVLYVGTLRKGNETEAEITDDVHVTFGNPTAVVVLVNGVDVGRPGMPGRVGRVIYRPDGSSKVLKKE